MYRILQLDKCDKIPIIVDKLFQFHLPCRLCYPCYQQKSGFSMSYSKRIQYRSALKYLLQKKTKKQNKKHYVEVLQGTESHMKNIRASVDVMRGKQLTALTTQLTVINNTSISSRSNHFSTALQSTECIRRYDPILVLPGAHSISPLVDIASEQQKKTNIISDVRIPNTDGSLNLSLGRDQSFPSNDRGKNQIVNTANVENMNEATPALIYEIRNQKCDPEKNLTIMPKFSKSEGISLNTTSVESSKAGNDKSPLSVMKNVKRISSKTSLTKKTREAVALQKLSELSSKKKQESVDANFLSFVDVCVNSGLVNDAFIAVKVYRRKCEQSSAFNPKITDIEVYNIIMGGYAKAGNWTKIKKLMMFAESDNVPFNAQTYAAILECLSEKNNLELIQCQIENMNKQNIKVNEVLTNTKITAASYKQILKAIQLVLPDYHVELPPINLNYDCDLLNHLNEQSSSFTSPVPPSVNKDNIKYLYDEQIKVEHENYVKIRTVEKRSDNLQIVSFYRNLLAKTKSEWKKTIKIAFDRELDLIRKEEKYKPQFYFTILPYLLSIPKDDHVDIVMHEIRKLAEGSETYSPTTRQLYRELGTQVFLRYLVKKKIDSGAMDQLTNLFQEYSSWYLEPDKSAANSRQKWQLILHQNSATKILCSTDPIWKPHVLIGVGNFLYNIIIRDVKININIFQPSSVKEHFLPAFYTLFRTKGHSCKEQVKPHPTLSRLYRTAAPEHLVFEASKIPMICPPLPWTTISSGGYLLTKTDLIRLPYQAIAQWKALEASPVPKLYPAFDSLNQLAAVPWTVNNQVLDVVLEVFRSGGSEQLDVPQPSSACPTAPIVTPDMLPKERSEIFRQRMALRRKRAEMYSLWCDALYKLSLADHFRGKVFWLPHNMDFRGRVYPVAPHLNHLGSDLSRSLLIFAKGQPLGSEGLNWLKIHTINLTGTHKKKSMEERLKYADSVLDDIIDSAERPLTGRMWWKESEEPWQTLAACIEVRNALASGNPTCYVSRFPVHQDGSCNGLQHYAALGRDLAGGKSVNLTPANEPQDVYSCVAAIVERERAKDAANGLAIAQQLEGFIQRKVIKQTVMTTVYGVTRFGARLQIARQLKDLNKFPKQYVWQASMYLVNKTFDSLQEMFTSTKEIQDWFTECARLIAQVTGENVQWITPLGLPIVQPYSKTTASNTPSNFKFIGAQTNYLSDAFERPNVMKQKNAFAPNFVHSLDSSHMMLTSIDCERNGVTFVSVHDCYWTHACDVPVMNRVCRSQFVALHSQPILPNLSQYFNDRFSYQERSFMNDGSAGDLAKRTLNRILCDLPTTGDLDLDEVLKSPYFFS